jgi:acetyl-CoA C-acetyltransferase
MMSANRVAVVGVGQTQYAAVRGDVSLPGLLREAAYRALADAHMTMDDIDAIVVGKAPDFFEGVMMPEGYLAEALGAVGKPLFRVHTAGSVGGSTAIVAASHIESGVHERVLTIGWEMQSCSEAMWALSFPLPFQQQLVAGAGGYFAPYIREYMRRSDAPDDIGILVALKDRLNALKNPYAHLHEPDITYDSVKESFMLWEPIRYSETCPSSDGAIALVLAGEQAAEASAASTGVAPAWIHGTSMRSEPAMASGRDQVSPQASLDCAADVYRQAGITNPRQQVDVVEMYVPFSWYEPMWLESLGFAEINQGWKMTESGATQMSGDLPVNCSGGVLSTNPIGASGMIRFGEAAMQVRNQAGDHQIDGAKVAVGHAYGGAAQFFAMWVVGSAKP